MARRGETMTTITMLGRVAAAIALLHAMVAGPAIASSAVDGSAPMLCAISTIMECDGTEQCQRHTAVQRSDFPSFLRIDLAQRTIVDGQNSDRKTVIASATRLDGRLILHGGENGRGWAATIAEDTGRMSAGVVADEFTFVLFGTCLTP